MSGHHPDVHLSMTFDQFLTLLDRLIGDRKLDQILHNQDLILERIATMSETADQAFSELQALAQKQANDSAKLKADVTTLLARLPAAGPLTPAQQAVVDQIKGLMTTADADTTGTDDAVTAATPPTP